MKSYFKKMCWAYVMGLTSAFNSPSVLKSRILMLYRKPSKKVSLAKFAFALPVVLLCGLLNACLHKEFVGKADKKEDNPRIVLMKNQQGELIETLHFDGEKDDYEKVADRIGLTNFLANKAEHSAAETMRLYADIVNVAVPELQRKEDARRMQSALYRVLLEKQVHRSQDIKQTAFMAEEFLKHPFALYFFANPSEINWFADVLPKLKKHWSAKKYHVYKESLVRIIEKESPQIFLKPAFSFDDCLATIKKM